MAPEARDDRPIASPEPELPPPAASPSLESAARNRTAFGVVSLVVLIATIFLPTDGIGFDICAFHRMTDLACPGCGMTRGLTSITHGDFGRAWRFHPFAFAFYPLLALAALSALVPALRGPRAPSERVEEILNRSGAALLIAFTIFGITRLVFGDWWY
jgi:hypothetical protein